MFKKLTDKLQKSPKLKKVICGVGAVVMCMTMLAPAAFATDGTGTTQMAPDAAATEVFGMLTEQINFTTILSVIGVALGAALAIFLGWWAIRKVSGMVLNAFKKGKVSV